MKFIDKAKALTLEVLVEGKKYRPIYEQDDDQLVCNRCSFYDTEEADDCRAVYLNCWNQEFDNESVVWYWKEEK